MPVLNWIGKESVVNHDKDVPFKLLKKIKSSSYGENSENLIIKGDNLEALKALMPYYKGKIKCIYIDPPYNTGNEKWVYNDNVNSSKIKKWLGKVVGGESEDLCRHDKWLCMMYPRLKLLRELLSEEGVIFVSIDDNEHCNLKQILEEIFGNDNFLTNIIWQKKYTQSNDAKYFSNTHDFIVCFAKNKMVVNIGLITRTKEQNDRYKNPDNDPRGPWMTQPLHAKSGTNGDFKYTFKNGVTWMPPKNTYPRFTIETLKKSEEENLIWFGNKGTAVPRLKKYLNDMKEGIIPKSMWLYNEVGSNDDGRKELKNLFGEAEFQTPKPVKLLKQIFQLTTKNEDIIIDSFAGSGTTGHAVLDLNKEDGGNRKFILIEMEDDIARKITAERVKLAIKKYEYNTGFEFCELDKPLFNEFGDIDESCSFEQLANYIYFTETQTNIDKNKINGNFIGDYQNNKYYLLFKEKGTNILDKSFFEKIKNLKDNKIIYADKCLIDNEVLEKYNITFKQIPYEVKVY
ncbi:MAG: site-specific DNA-methyltransferase [Candidatus Nanoarchaeia archaeon]|jgi:adenine-specific DNA-methyltransferase